MTYAVSRDGVAALPRYFINGQAFYRIDDLRSLFSEDAIENCLCRAILSVYEGQVMVPIRYGYMLESLNDVSYSVARQRRYM